MRVENISLAPGERRLAGADRPDRRQRLHRPRDRRGRPRRAAAAARPRPPLDHHAHRPRPPRPPPRPMNLITDTLRALVRRKLWPVALLLVGALVAVPLVLAKEPTSGAARRPNAQPPRPSALPATFVSAADDSADRGRQAPPRARRRARTRSSRPRCRRPRRRRRPRRPTSKQADDRDATPDGRLADRGAAPAAARRDPAGQRRPPTATPDADGHRPGYSIKVRFGATDDRGPRGQDRRAPVGAARTRRTPVLVYRGVEDGGKVAIFELTGDVDAQGDGKCEPTPEDCQYLKLRAGETEFITVTDTGEARPTPSTSSTWSRSTRRTTKAKVRRRAPRPQPLAKAVLGAEARLRYATTPQPLRLRREDRHAAPAPRAQDPASPVTLAAGADERARRALGPAAAR